MTNQFLSGITCFTSLKAWSFLYCEVLGSSEIVFLMEMLRHGSKKQGTGPLLPQETLLLTKALLPLKLIRFWYQASFSYTSLPLQHAWNCKALSIIYLLLFVYCVLWMPSLEALSGLLLLIWRSPSSPFVLRHTFSAGLSPTHLLLLVGEL